MDGVQVQSGPPDTAQFVKERGPERGELRHRVWHRLHDPEQSAQLREDLEEAGVSEREFQLMKQHWCPLGFENHEQYLDFMDELSISIGSKCHKMQQLAEGQAPLRGF